MLIDLTNKNISGKEYESILEEINITVNKNAIPNDPRSPFVTSGIRIGTPNITTRGLKEEQMTEIAYIMARVLSHPEEKQKLKQQVINLCNKFPVYINY